MQAFSQVVKLKGSFLPPAVLWRGLWYFKVSLGPALCPANKTWVPTIFLEFHST